MGDRRESRKSKRNMLSSCVTPAYMNGLETMTLTMKQQGEVCDKQPGKNNSGRAKRADKKKLIK